MDGSECVTPWLGGNRGRVGGRKGLAHWRGCDVLGAERNGWAVTCWERGGRAAANQHCRDAVEKEGCRYGGWMVLIMMVCGQGGMVVGIAKA